ncbi:MAG TPA: toll/interleukin-1 receptor domain-containing protein [Burkholderiales bacterium]|nr:toll/interleukin-1 receptor domain-containing protein [Burkholderiales bacterium]
MNEVGVFISYSHDSEEHGNRVRGLNASLSRDGCECHLDVFKDTDEDWPTWMTRQLVEADFVLCVVTETYERRFRDNELPDQGLGVGWEAGLIRRLLYTKKLRNNRIFPVFFHKQDRKHIPIELQGFDYFQLDGPAGYEALLRKVQNQPQYFKPAVGAPPTLGTTAAAPLFPRPGNLPAPKVDISRILEYAPGELIGREEELKRLDDAWTKVQNQDTARPRVLTFVALGGEGKTSLIAKWAAELAHRNWPGCDAAFAWSFYSQGTREQLAASSDLFLKEALVFFASTDEDREFAAGPAGSFNKGQHLASLVGQRKCLLILDGLEPLQYAPTAPTPGQLKDQGIAVLLKRLATSSHGLCVVTTRYSLPDLKAFWQGTAPEVKLERLSREAGVHLLKTLGVKGSELRNIPFNCGKEQVNEFEKLVEDVKGHALTLNLLGTYLRDAHGGDIRKRDLAKLEEADAEEQGGHAFRVMDAYSASFKNEGDKGQRALAVLRLLGLFDRPATADCLAALLEAPGIPDLTEPLAGTSAAEKNVSFSRLEAARLLTVNRDTAGALVSLDAHPLLRDYFARQLREQKPDAWRAAHRQLYEHLRATTKEGDQPTLEDLQPLYQAVAHGCQAGLQEEALKAVYCSRISGPHVYSQTRLGAFGADLGVARCFFEQPWTDVSPSLSRAAQAYVLNLAGFCLRALGRPSEALEPMRASLEITNRLAWCSHQCRQRQRVVGCTGRPCHRS